MRHSKSGLQLHREEFEALISARERIFKKFDNQEKFLKAADLSDDEGDETDLELFTKQLDPSIIRTSQQILQTKNYSFCLQCT